MAGAAKGACDAIASAGPQAILEAVQNLLYGPEAGRLAMTCAIAIIDNAKESIQVTCAGHPFPLMISPGGTVSPIIAKGDPLGILPTITATTITRPMQRGASLVFYTDGITECENQLEQPFGDKRMWKAIRSSAGRSANEIVKAIVNSVDRHRDGTTLDDDLTLVVAQRT